MFTSSDRTSMYVCFRHIVQIDLTFYVKQINWIYLREWRKRFKCSNMFNAVKMKMFDSTMSFIYARQILFRIISLVIVNRFFSSRRDERYRRWVSNNPLRFCINKQMLLVSLGTIDTSVLKLIVLLPSTPLTSRWIFRNTNEWFVHLVSAI